MATVNQTLFDSAGRSYRVILAEDTSGNKFIPLVDSDGYLQVGHNITGIGHGVKTVSTNGTDEALAASTACKRVIIQAQTDNGGAVAIGAAGVDATVATGNGISLVATSPPVVLDIDNLADIYVDAVVAGEGVRYIYFT